MLIKNTDQIVANCFDAIKEYDMLCRGFFGKPGKEGINRKDEFLRLVTGLQQNTPEEAFIKIYDFYLSQKSTSRLNKIIENKLMQILDIPKPKTTGNIHQDADEILQAQNTFHQKSSLLKSNMGITDKNEVPLMTISGRK